MVDFFMGKICDTWWQQVVYLTMKMEERRWWTTLYYGKALVLSFASPKLMNARPG